MFLYDESSINIKGYESVLAPFINIDTTSVTCDILSILTQQFDTKFETILQQMEREFKPFVFQILNQNWNIFVS